MNKRRWLALAAGLGIPLIYYALQTRGLRKQIRNLRDFDMPSARLYDAFWGSIYAGFYERVADEVAKEYPKGRILEVGSGPGRLALQIALAAPEVEITGVDIAADMIERAKGLVEAEGQADRVRFEIGDVSSLPYPDGQFDLVVSTLSLHHWPDPALGLLEIRRVIKP